MIKKIQYIQYNCISVIAHPWKDGVHLEILNGREGIQQLAIYKKGETTPLLELDNEYYHLEGQASKVTLLVVDGIHTTTDRWSNGKELTGIPKGCYATLGFHHDKNYPDLILRIIEGKDFVELEITKESVEPLNFPEGNGKCSQFRNF